MGLFKGSQFVEWQIVVTDNLVVRVEEVIDAHVIPLAREYVVSAHRDPSKRCDGRIVDASKRHNGNFSYSVPADSVHERVELGIPADPRKDVALLRSQRRFDARAILPGLLPCSVRSRP